MQETNDLLGKVLLIGITFLDRENKLIEQYQTYGKIVKADTDGIGVERQNEKELFMLPPAFDNIQPARPGEYRLRSTGEVVINPDYLTSWTVNDTTDELVENHKKRGFHGFQQSEETPGL